LVVARFKEAANGGRIRNPARSIVLPFLRRRWFLLALLVVLVCGWWNATAWKWFADQKAVRNTIVFTVLFLMALPVDSQVMLRTARRPWPALLATLINFGLLPGIAWGVSGLLSRELGWGLLVAATTPCTLASASVWTRRAGGNDAVSMMVTILTNLLCFVVTPAWLTIMTGTKHQAASLEFGAMVIKLGLLVLAPMLLAQLLRLHPSVARWSTARRGQLGVAALIGVLSMILMGTIQAGAAAGDRSDSSLLIDLLPMFAAVAGLHTGMLIVGMYLAGWLRMSREDQIAVGIAGSQKTLMVGLQVALDLGVSPFPMITYHVGQLLIDTIIADRLRQRDRAAEPPPRGPPAGGSAGGS
jgi:sodium/bile acid cotransporter 7